MSLISADELSRISTDMHRNDPGYRRGLARGFVFMHLMESERKKDASSVCFDNPTTAASRLIQQASCELSEFFDSPSGVGR